MQLALECPPAYASDLIPLTDFNFLLTHLVLGNKDYRNYYTITNAGLLPFTVLDNSVNELGQPCSLEEINKAAEIINPDIIIPPDFLGDWKKTGETLEEGISIWGGDKIWPVIQGSTQIEVIRCFNYLLDLGFRTICIPYDITLDRTYSLRQLSEARVEAVKNIVTIDPNIKIHLLGFNTFEEIDRLKFFPKNIISIDTGSPYTNASHSRLMDRETLVPKGVYIDYNDNYSRYTMKDTLYNLAYMRKRFNSIEVPVGV